MSRNPDYKFVDKDTSTLLANMTAMYEKLTGNTLQPASPEMLFLSWIATVLVYAYTDINYAANQNIPSRASGENLDALGELLSGVRRPVAKPAVCQERFTISGVQNYDVVIPAGTRCTDSSRSITWATTVDAVIPAGETETEVLVECTQTGTAGNGFVPGQICIIVDLFDYFASCTNVTTSDGGADRATDEEYYTYLKASSDAFSTAGPIGAYEFHASSVSTEISDVKAIRPNRVIQKYVPVWGGHAFIGGEFLDADSLIVDGGAAGVDYNAIYDGSLIDIVISPTGNLRDRTSLICRVKSIDAGKINIYALMADGSIASETIKELILKACNDSTVRPLTDLVSVEDPDVVEYDIEVTYYAQRGSTTSLVELGSAVNDAVAEYQAWQSGRLGRDINPSVLISKLMAVGTKRVEVASPAFRTLRDGTEHEAPQVAKVRSVTIRSGGWENE